MNICHLISLWVCIKYWVTFLFLRTWLKPGNLNDDLGEGDLEGKIVPILDF